MAVFKAWLVGLVFLAGAFAAQAQVALDLRNVDLARFVRIISDITGRNFVLDSRATGTVSVIAPADVSEEVLYEIFLNVLELNRLTIVQGRDADRIVPAQIARELSSSGVAGQGAFETRAIEVENGPFAEIVDVVRGLLPQEAVLSAMPQARVLIISDRSSNLDRIEALVRELDRAEDRSVETIRLSNGKSADVLRVIQALEIVPPGASLTEDPRGNSIVVSGPPEYRTRIRNIALELDTPQRSMASEVVRLSYADAASLAEVMRQSFDAGSAEGGGGNAEITIVAEPRTNALLVTAPADRMGAVVGSIRSLDQRPSQVLVEAVIFEVSAQTFSDLSVQFGGVLNDALAGGVQFSLDGRPTLTALVSSVFAGQPVSTGDGGMLGGVQTNSSGNGFAAFIAALARESSTRLLSTPSIMTLNNQEAEIVVAQNVPFVTGRFSTVGDSAVPNEPFQTIQRQDVGLTLRVTPQITVERTVRMAIHQEASNLTNTASAAGGEITAKRSLSTNVLVGDGRVIMLGGLMEDGSGVSSQRVPGLSNLPVLGNLFRGRNVSKSQRVLLIMLRPRIVATDAEARALTQGEAQRTAAASAAIALRDDGRYPRIPASSFPFDGADLNQPFDAAFVDDVARRRQFPTLPTRLNFLRD